MLRLLVTGVFAFAIATAASAQDIVDATDPAALLNIARGFGSANLDTDSTGDPHIRGRIGGTGYGIVFFGCDDNHENCTSVSFTAGWTDLDLSLEKINAWNDDRRWPTAAQDEEGDTVVRMAINLEDGVTYANMEKWFFWWQHALETFIEYARENG